MLLRGHHVTQVPSAAPFRCSVTRPDRGVPRGSEQLLEPRSLLFPKTSEGAWRPSFTLQGFSSPAFLKCGRPLPRLTWPRPLRTKGLPAERGQCRDEERGLEDARRPVFRK